MAQSSNGTPLFVEGAATNTFEIKTIEGRRIEQGRMLVKLLVERERILVVEVFRPKGFIAPPHIHPDHDSAGYLISGRLRLVIEGHEFVASSGDAWSEPAGVEHWSEALTDVLNIEVKSPPVHTWSREILR